MRRDEFLCDDMDFIVSMLHQIPFATLIIPDTPFAYALPLSFCFDKNYADKGAVYFHGAKSGRKFELLQKEHKVSLSVAKPYSYIPSSFLEGKMIPTQFFFSVFIEGSFKQVQDLAFKRDILSKLVQKYEPENAEFSMQKGQFKGSENGVFVGLVKVQNLSAKAKFGQNLNENAFETIINDLKRRHTAQDKDTVDLMHYFRQK